MVREVMFLDHAVIKYGHNCIVANLLDKENNTYDRLMLRLLKEWLTRHYPTLETVQTLPPSNWGIDGSEALGFFVIRLNYDSKEGARFLDDLNHKDIPPEFDHLGLAFYSLDQANQDRVEGEKVWENY